MTRYTLPPPLPSSSLRPPFLSLSVRPSIFPCLLHCFFSCCPPACSPFRSPVLLPLFPCPPPPLPCPVLTQYILERVVTVNDLLRAAGGTGHGCSFLSLDDRSDSMNDGSQSLRYSGTTLIVYIDYDNTKTFDQNDVEFTMRVRRLPNTEHKVEYTTPGQKLSLTKITELTVHGILVVVVQTGKLGLCLDPLAFCRSHATTKSKTA